MTGLAVAEAGGWRLARRSPYEFARRAVKLVVGVPPTTTAVDLQGAVDRLVAGHDILRTSYRSVGAQLVREVDDDQRHLLTIGPSAELPEPDRDRLCTSDLLRFGYDERRDEAWVVASEMLLDTHSGQLLRRALMDQLATPSIPVVGRFSEYVELAGESASAATPVGVRSVGSVRPVCAAGKSGYGERVRVLPDAATVGFRALCRSLKLTPFMAVVALAAHQVAVQFATRDVALSTAIDRRPRDLAGVLGNFSADVAIELSVESDFRSTAAAARAAVLRTLRTVGHQVSEPANLPAIRCHYLPTGRHFFTVLDRHEAGDVWDEQTDTSAWPMDFGFAEDGKSRLGLWQQWDRQAFSDSDAERLALLCTECLLDWG
ncbi:hypothetical protein AB0H36_33990 [Kribbella sp. NPDC050820]|uniref:hypothetical protein n=1 Tax=Kribbella sp. NPDC050820 TaxID=3155408 RepID=UPI0033DC19B5